MSNANEEPIVAFLQDPAAYPHPVDTPIETVQTHISWVFLTGEFAYKIKKPAKLSFLDFSTLAKRKYYCEQELRLNRALSPELYLDVVPIYGDGESFSLGEGTGEPVEYAVKMRQFREDDVLIRVFEAGQLTRAHIVELAERVAAMHREARNGPELADYGSLGTIADTLADHFRIGEDFMGVTQTREQQDRTRAYTERFMTEQEPLFRKRTERGFIRECHGDLHLGNICLYDGRIRFFDRIEYNEPFKNIDVIYDLAFLFMDLRFRGRDDLAYRFVNTYAELTGDYEGLLLLPFYACGRALVRAKVRSILSAEEEADPKQRDRAREEANAYFTHAAGYARSTPGALVITCGLSGSGKTTAAQAVSESMPALHLRSDAIRKHLAGVPLDETNDALYTRERTQRTYDELLRLGAALAAQGAHVVLDATFGSRAVRDAARRAAEEAGTPFGIVWADAPEALLRQRLRDRRGDVSDADEAVLEKQLDRFQAPAPEEQALRLDTAVAFEADGLVDRLHRDYLP